MASTGLASLLLVSCGGGGGGGGNGGGGPVVRNEPAPPQTGSPQPPQAPQAPQRPQSSNPYETLGNARPRPGSVTHSSNLDSSNITIDKVTLSAFRISDDESGFIVKNGDNWTTRILNGVGNLNPLKPGYQFQLEETPLGPDVLSSGFAGNDSTVVHDFFEQYDRSFGYSNNYRANYPVQIYMREGYTDTDYLGYGYWISSNLRFTNNVTVHDELGIFVDGSDPYNQNNLISLTGTATYRAPIQAILINIKNGLIDSDGSRDRNLKRNRSLTYYDGIVNEDEIYGNINLTADFNDSDSLGTIEGSMSDFHATHYSNQWDNDGNLDDNEFEVRTIPGTINLETTSISSAYSGFAEGNVSGTFNGETYTGKWGSQFYGNDSPDGKPEHIGGTMAAKSDDGDFVIYSGWIADKEEN